MVSIKSITELISDISKAEKVNPSQQAKAMYDVFSKMTSGYTPARGKDLPRVCYEILCKKSSDKIKIFLTKVIQQNLIKSSQKKHSKFLLAVLIVL